MTCNLEPASQKGIIPTGQPQGTSCPCEKNRDITKYGFPIKVIAISPTGPT